MDATTKGWHLPQTHAVPIKVVKKEVDPLDATIQKMLMKKKGKNERKKERKEGERRSQVLN